MLINPFVIVHYTFKRLHYYLYLFHFGFEVVPKIHAVQND